MSLKNTINRIISSKKSKQGTTMIEVLVAFMIVMIMTALFAKSITISAQLLSKSQQVIARTETFDQNYYKTASRSNRVDQNIQLSLSVDTVNCNNSNKAKATSLTLDKAKLQKYTDNNMTRYSIGYIGVNVNPAGE